MSILPVIESLYDLLYTDGRRIATYMAQLDPNGSLTGIKLTGSQSTNLKAEGKVSGIVLSGAMEGSDTATEGIEREFDPLWSIPIAMLNRLDELSFISRNLPTATIGSLVLVKGWPRVIDIRMLREMWPAIGKMMEMQMAAAEDPGNRHDRRKTQGQGPRKSTKGTVVDALVEVVSRLPHAIELHMVTGDGVLWCTLDPKCMLTSADDVALKHGCVIPGDWYLLGVLDAQPNGEDEPGWAQLPASEITQGMIKLLSIIRAEMGRPKQYYGITPLMLFRSVERNQTAP